MPPLKTYTFKHIKSDLITITVETYGDKDKAKKVLERYVIDVNEWYL